MKAIMMPMRMGRPTVATKKRRKQEIIRLQVSTHCSLLRNDPIIPTGTLRKAATPRAPRIFSIMLYISLIFFV